MAQPPSSLDHLVREAQRGNHTAFEGLVRAHLPMVRAVALGVTAQLEASDEVAQQTFLVAWRRIRGLRDPARFSGWIRRIARNLGHKHVRSQRRRIARVRPDSDAVANAAVATSGTEAAVLVQNVLAQLSEEERVLVVLFHRDGWSSAELADHLGISEAAVRQRLHRARKRCGEIDEGPFAAGVRSRSHAGLLLAISATVTGTPPRPPGLRAAVAMAVVALLVSLGWWLAPELSWESDATAAPSLRPQATARGQRAAAQAAEAPSSSTPRGAIQQAIPYELWLNLESPREYHGSLMQSRHTDGTAFFPTPEEAPLPAGATTELLQQILDMEAEGTHPGDRVHALFEAADAEGMAIEDPELLEDPWRALTALEVATRRVHNDEIEAMYRQERYPVLRYGRIEAAATQLMEAWRPEPVADFFRLYVLEAALTHHSDVFDFQRGIDRAVALMEETDDDLVLMAAGRRVADAFGPIRLTGDQRSVVEDLIPELPARQTAALWSALARAALADGDIEQTVRLNEQARQAVLARCPDWPAVAPPPGGVRDPAWASAIRCSFAGQDVDEIEGRLAALDPARTPSGWRAALIALGWRCHLQHPGTDEVTTFLVAEGGRWRADPWSGPQTPFTRCIDGHLPSLPAADVGFELLWRMSREP